MKVRIDSKRTAWFPLLGLVALLSGLAGSAFADETCPKERAKNKNMDPNHCPTYTFHWENDALTGTDRYYTNGIQWSKLWKTKGEVENTAGWARRFHRLLQEYTDKKNTGNVLEIYRGAAYKNVFYTPVDITVRPLIENDRPYAGWSAASSLFEVRKEWRDDDGNPEGSQHRLEGSIGIIGKAAFGGPLQAFAHEFLSPSSADPKGWTNQLDTEPTAQLFYRYRRLWVRKFIDESEEKMFFDVTPHLTGTAGNAFIYAGAGFTSRLGYNVPPTFSGPIEVVAPDTVLKGTLSLYAFVSAEGRAVGRNIFLDGNTFSSSHSVDKEILVADWQAGFSVRCGRYSFTYLTLTRTPEFDLQDDNQSWGSVSLAVSPKGKIPFCIGKKNGG